MPLLLTNVGRHLHHHRAEISQAVLTRIGENHTLPITSVSSSAFIDPDEMASNVCLDRVTLLIESLSQSLCVAEPILFSDFLQWFGDVLSHQHPIRNSADLREGLIAVEQVLAALLPDNYFQATRPFLAAGLAAITGQRDSASGMLPAPHEANASTPLAERYLNRLLASDRRGAREVIAGALRADLPISQIYIDILQPALREVGRLWQIGQVGTAQEHYCSAETCAIIARLAFDTAWSPPVSHERAPLISDRAVFSLLDKPAKKTFLAACVAGEYHDIGLRMTADLLERAGWDVHYLGANTPADAIATEAATLSASIVGLSATLSTHLNAVAQAIRALRRQPACTQTPILVGGRPFLLAPGLADRLGAAGIARDAQHAVEMAQLLVGAAQP